MNKLDVFIGGCKASRWKWRTWRGALFNVSRRNPSEPLEEYDIDYTPEGAVVWIGGKWERIEDHKGFEALYDNRELANFPANSVPNCEEPIQTTYGRMLYNWMVISYAFGNKIPFQHKTTQKAVVKMFSPFVRDKDFVPPEGDTQTYYTPEEVSRFVQASLEITSICTAISPTGTDKSLTTDPRVYALRDKLIKEHKGELTQADITHIQNQLIAMDKAWLADDEASDFYLSGSAYTVKRKKLFLMHGIETAFQEGGKFDFIEKSLSEGTDLSKTTAVNNAIREGSYDRGADTALGGAMVVFLQRMHQNDTVVVGDCGGASQPIMLTDYNKYHYIGMNIMVNNKPITLTEEMAKANVGKIIKLRRPILCNCQPPAYCSSCTSHRLGENPRSIISSIAEVASNIMLAFMSSMHGNELAVARFNFKNHIK